MKHLLTLALCCVMAFSAQAQIPSYVPTNGLVGWWPFNGNANDESGNGNHGTVNGATLAADRFGNVGKAYSFDGVNSRIVTNSFFSINNDFSISIWSNSISSKGQVLFNSDPHTIIALVYFPFWKPSNGIGFLYGTGAAGGWINNNYAFSNTVPLIGSWSNIVVTKFNNKFKIYQNGNLIDTLLSANSLTNILTPVIIGNCTQGICNDGFEGLLDDIAIYNRALSAAEVQQLYLGKCTQSTFTTQPQNKSVAQGQTTTFAVQVDTTATFQWQMNLGYGQNWVNVSNSAQISGATDDTLTVEGRYQIDGAQFRCIATACQSDTSNAATLTVTSNSSTLGSVAGVPGKINYQGAAVDSLGKPLKNQTILLKLSVLDSSTTGAAAYVETHSTPTNGNGLFSLQIGGGTAVSGTFDSIPWANGRNKYLKTEVQQNGTWVNLGTSQLVSVPYALHAGSAENAKNATNIQVTGNDGQTYALKVGPNGPDWDCMPKPTTANAGQDQLDVCTDSVLLTGNLPTVGKAQWRIISGFGGQLVSPDSSSTYFKGLANQEYIIRYSIGNICIISSDDLVVKFGPTKPSAFAGIDQLNLSVTMAALSANPLRQGENGLWSVSSGIGGFFTSTSNPSTIFSKGIDTIYQLVWTVSSVCGIKKDTIQLNFSNLNCGQSIVYQAESYPTVQIGSQCWFQKNVNVGTMVLGANDQTNNGTLEKYCYNNDTTNCSIYGGLYQWAEVVQYQNGASNTTSPNPALTGNVQGICPTGWHVPNNWEYCNLITFLDTSSKCIVFGTLNTTAGGMLKSTNTLWSYPNIGASNSSQFSALPSGYRGKYGGFGGIGNFTNFWTSSESISEWGWGIYLDSGMSNINKYDWEKSEAYPIRCIKD